MCDVMTSAGALGLAGPALSGLGRVAAARRAGKQAKKEARAAEADGKARAEKVRRRARREGGNRRARFAKAGVRVDGTPAAVLADIAAEAEAEAAGHIETGRRRADGIRERAAARRRQARTSLLGTAGRRFLGGFPVAAWPGDLK